MFKKNLQESISGAVANIWGNVTAFDRDLCLNCSWWYFLDLFLFFPVSVICSWFFWQTCDDLRQAWDSVRQSEKTSFFKQLAKKRCRMHQNYRLLARYIGKKTKHNKNNQNTQEANKENTLRKTIKHAAKTPGYWNEQTVNAFVIPKYWVVLGG